LNSRLDQSKHDRFNFTLQKWVAVRVSQSDCSNGVKQTPLTFQIASSFLQHIKNESVEEISAAILQTDFLCVDVSEGNQEDTSALVMELGNFPTLVGFTTEDHAGTFAEYFKDVPLDENDELKCFNVSGREFLTTLPRQFGIAINLETEHEIVFEPKFTRALKKAAH